MKKILPPLLLAFALVCGFTACSSVEVITVGVKLELTGIQRTGDGVVHVTWRVQNPNVTSYLLQRTTHKLSLNGTLVGTITDEAPLGVPAQNSTERTGVLKPAKIPANATIDQAVAQGSAPYRVDAVLTVLLLDDNVEKIPVTYSGTVTVTAK